MLYKYATLWLDFRMITWIQAPVHVYKFFNRLLIHNLVKNINQCMHSRLDSDIKVIKYTYVSFQEFARHVTFRRKSICYNCMNLNIFQWAPNIFAIFLSFLKFVYVLVWVTTDHICPFKSRNSSSPTNRFHFCLRKFIFTKHLSSKKFVKNLFFIKTFRKVSEISCNL